MLCSVLCDSKQNPTWFFQYYPTVSITDIPLSPVFLSRASLWDILGKDEWGHSDLEQETDLAKVKPWVRGGFGVRTQGSSFVHSCYPKTILCDGYFCASSCGINPSEARRLVRTNWIHFPVPHSVALGGQLEISHVRVFTPGKTVETKAPSPRRMLLNICQHATEQRCSLFIRVKNWI